MSPQCGGEGVTAPSNGMVLDGALITRQLRLGLTETERDLDLCVPFPVSAAQQLGLLR